MDAILTRKISARPWFIWGALIAALMVLDSTLAAWNGQTQGEVDVLLVIALDVSGSVDGGEFDLQREGLARAIVSPDVVEAIAGGINGSIAVSVVQWSGFTEQIVKIDWMRLANLEDAHRFAAQTRRMTRRYKNGATDISGAIEYTHKLFAMAPYPGRRRVIDIVGDGTNNVNFPPHFERDKAVEAGVEINALAVTGSPSILAEYFRDNVIGGSDAFVESVIDYQGFEDAMRHKLLREIENKLLF